MTRTRWAGIGSGIALLALAIWGGEYGTADWITFRRQLADERARVAALRIELDSLATLAHDLDFRVAFEAAFEPIACERNVVNNQGSYHRFRFRLRQWIRFP